MRDVNVYLPSAMAVQEFVEGLSSLDGDFDLISGKYILDARSLMGIFSLDLTKPLCLRVYKDTEEAMEHIKKFLPEEEAGK